MIKEPWPFVTVVALDPGETTGWTTMRCPIENLIDPSSRPLEQVVRMHRWKYGEIDCRAIASSDEAQKVVRQYQGLNISGEVLGTTDMMNLIVNAVNPCVVVEDFILDADKAQSFRGDRSALTPVRLISSLAFGMYWEQIQATLIIQNRTDPKRICTDQRLRQWNLYDTNSGPHARDATRHAFHFLRNCRGLDAKAAERRWIAWPQLFDDPIAEKRNAPKKVRPKGERIPGLG